MLQYALVGNEDGTGNITVLITGHDLLVAHSSHPNYEDIVFGAIEGDESIVDLFDIAVTATNRFERLTERVTTAHGRLYLDGVEVHNSLAEQVVRFLREGVEDWKPLVNFFENVQSNPNEHSRTQLYSWLENRDFTITPEGNIVGYKGVRSDGSGGWQSINRGTAIVNGTVFTGAIPNGIGDIVEMPRDQVTHDPAVGCHRGLHVGTYEYANSFSQGGLLEVHVNPRDVVSVPTDTNHQKMRVCRYKVVNTITQPYATAVSYVGYDDEYEDDEYEVDDGWGDSEY